MKIPRNMQSNQITIHNMQSHLENRHIKMYLLVKHTFYENLLNIQQFRHYVLVNNV